MARIVIPDGNTTDHEITVNEGDEVVIGKNNSGKITIKGSNGGSVTIGDDNSGEIVVEDDNEGVIRVGEGNRGKIRVADVNEGTIGVGAGNHGDIETGDDNEGTISIGDRNRGNIRVGDVNEGTIETGAENRGDIDIADDNDGIVALGQGNKGKTNVGDAQDGTISGCSSQRCWEFFRDYDRRFQFVTGQTASDVGRLLGPPGGPPGILRRRYDERVAGAGTTPPPPVPAPDADDCDADGRLSTAQLQLFRDHFATTDGSLDYDCIQQCFMAFCNGEYRDPATPKDAGTKPGEPDGDFEFLFAEFALLAIECGHDADAWKKLLRVFVKSEEIFITVYKKDQDDPIEDRKYKGPQVDRARKDDLEREFERMSQEELEERHRDILRRAAAQPAEKISFLSPSDRERAIGLAALVREAAIVASRFAQAGKASESGVAPRWPLIAERLTAADDLLRFEIEGKAPRLSFLGVA